jgi:uncharacterized protein
VTPPDIFLSALVIFLGVFTQSLTGFGSGLVTMAFLPAMIGIQAASPLVALVNIVIELALLVRFRHALQVRAIWPMIIASLALIPLGVWAVSSLDENLVLTVLGLVMVSFSGWALLGIRLPRLRHPAWGVVAGGLGGVLGGAYNTSGPPVILYGNCRGWPPAEFKANLTGYFIINSVFIVVNHAWSGHFNSDVLQVFALSLPAIALGMLAGFWLDRWINPVVFRKIVLGLLLVMGLRFILWSLF